MSQEKEADGEGGGRGVFDDRTQRGAALLQMAMSVVKENPSAAAEFATQSLRDGVSFGLQGVLIALQAQSFELSERVFRAALARVSASGLTDPNELLILYSYLYTPGRISAAPSSADQSQRTIAVSRDGAGIKPAAQYRPELAADFLRAAAELLLDAPAPASTPDPQTTARAQIGVIQTLLRGIEQVAPDKSAQLASRLQLLTADAQYSASPSSPPDGYIESRRGETAAEYNERRVDFLEKEAERQQSPLARDLAYAKAAAATEPDAYERGWRVADKIKDKGLRDDVTGWLTYRAALSLIKRGELSRALAARDEDLAQRAVCLVVGAQRLIGEKNYPGAGEWLGEARALLRKAPLDENWTKIALGVVAAYGKFDKPSALQALGEAVRVMNQFPTDESRADGAPPVQRFTGVVTSDITHGTQGFSLGAAVAAFGPQEFESVYGMLPDIEEPVARGEAVLVLCERFLTKEKPKPAKGEGEARPKASL